jgi:hypothetical protein
MSISRSDRKGTSVSFATNQIYTTTRKYRNMASKCAMEKVNSHNKGDSSVEYWRRPKQPQRFQRQLASWRTYNRRLSTRHKDTYHSPTPGILYLSLAVRFREPMNCSAVVEAWCCDFGFWRIRSSPPANPRPSLLNCQILLIQVLLFLCPLNSCYSAPKESLI